MPNWVFACDTCKRQEDRWFATAMERQFYEEKPIPCKPNPKTGRCTGHMVRQPSAPAFAIKGYSAANGYSEDH